nr:hypothetical protein [Tanacetum cinerariifolium]
RVRVVRFIYSDLPIGCDSAVVARRYDPSTEPLEVIVRYDCLVHHFLSFTPSEGTGGLVCFLRWKEGVIVLTISSAEGGTRSSVVRLMYPAYAGRLIPSARQGSVRRDFFRQPCISMACLDLSLLQEKLNQVMIEKMKDSRSNAYEATHRRVVVENANLRALK